MLPRALRGSFVEEERSKNMLGLACECEMSVFSQRISQRDLKVMNDRRDFELTSSDKNIKIRTEVVMFTLVCSIAAFNISTAKCNVTHSYIKNNICFSRLFQRISSLHT